MENGSKQFWNTQKCLGAINLIFSSQTDSNTAAIVWTSLVALPFLHSPPLSPLAHDAQIYSIFISIFYPMEFNFIC